MSTDTPEEQSITFTHIPVITIWGKMGFALDDEWLIQSPYAAGGLDHCSKRPLEEDITRDAALCKDTARELHVDDETAMGLFFCGLAGAEHLVGHEEASEYIRLGRPIKVGDVELTVYIMSTIHCSYIITDGMGNNLVSVEY